MLDKIRDAGESVVDSIGNFVNGLGTPADPGKGGQPYLDDRDRLSLAKLDILYLQNDLARRIVDEVVEDATRGGWEARTVDGNEVVEEPDGLDISNSLEEAAKMGRLYGGAHVFLVHSDANFKRPLAPDEGPPDNLVVLDRYEAQVSRETRDIEDQNFGEPQYYSLTPNTTAQGDDPNQAHHSRLLTFGGNPVPSRIDHFNDHYDDSVLQAVWESLRRFDQVESSIANIVSRFETSTISIAGLQNILQDEDGREAIQERMQIFQKGLSSINAALIDADAGEEYEREFATVNGLDTLWDRMAHSVAKAAKQPMTQLFGMSPSGIATDDQSGRANWRKQVGAYRENELRANLERYYSLIAGEPVTIHFPPLDETAPKEEAQIEKLKAETHRQYLDGGVLRVPEVRRQLEDDGQLRESDLAADAVVTDPYDGPDDPKIPDHVSAANRAKWAEKWNEVFKRTGLEGEAFEAANAAISDA